MQAIQQVEGRIGQVSPAKLLQARFPARGLVSFSLIIARLPNWQL